MTVLDTHVIVWHALQPKCRDTTCPVVVAPDV